MNRQSELYEYNQERKQLDVKVNWGFFATCDITLQALTNTCPYHDYITVNWPAQFPWRDENQAGMNLFERYFNPNKMVDPSIFVDAPLLPQYSIYEHLNFHKTNPYIRNYFAPSAIVRARLQEFICKYGIDCEYTIGLSYRATDKWIEIAQVQPDYYISEAKNLLARNSKLRVLIQTDQEQVRTLCMRELGKRAFYLNEMPVTSSATPVHRIPERERGVSNFEFGVRLLAAINLLARCKYLITHSGFVGLWTYLYRGTAKNTIQLRPGRPDIFSNLEGEIGVRRLLQKSIRRLIIGNFEV